MACPRPQPSESPTWSTVQGRASGRVVVVELGMVVVDEVVELVVLGSVEVVVVGLLLVVVVVAGGDTYGEVNGQIVRK